MLTTHDLLLSVAMYLILFAWCIGRRPSVASLSGRCYAQTDRSAS